MSVGPTEIMEGGDSSIIEVMPTLPVELLCENRTGIDGPETCEVLVEVTVAGGEAGSCVAGETYPQAVVGYYNHEITSYDGGS